MGSRTLLICDWCEVEAPEDGGRAPKNWAEKGGELLCLLCLDERERALKLAKANRIVRRTGEPVDINKVSVVDEWKGKAPRTQGEADHECG
jgi:hypothetical protein